MSSERTGGRADRFRLKQTVDSVLVSPDRECLQHATAYLKAILAYCQYRISPYAASLIFREHHGTRVCKLFRRPVANSLRIVRDSSSILTEKPMTTPIRRAASLRPGQFKHLIRVASVTGRLPERDVMLLWLTHTTGIRVTELALLKVAIASQIQLRVSQPFTFFTGVSLPFFEWWHPTSTTIHLHHSHGITGRLCHQGTDTKQIAGTKKPDRSIWLPSPLPGSHEALQFLHRSQE